MKKEKDKIKISKVLNVDCDIVSDLEQSNYAVRVKG